MILIVNCGSKYVHHIESCVDEFDDFITVPVLELVEEYQQVDGIIISGAPLLITEMDMRPYLEKTSWIKHIDIPILGICFGHQLIGLQYGALASKMKEDRNWQMVECFEETSLFERLPTEFEMMEDHCETISIPGDFLLVASSDVCVNEAMKHKTRNIFGVQFHPEISATQGRTIIDNFVRICHH